MGRNISLPHYNISYFSKTCKFIVKCYPEEKCYI
nr:MAG TPA: hypothetical protein [Caudoviricetes sp.]